MWLRVEQQKLHQMNNIISRHVPEYSQITITYIQHGCNARASAQSLFTLHYVETNLYQVEIKLSRGTSHFFGFSGFYRSIYKSKPKHLTKIFLHMDLIHDYIVMYHPNKPSFVCDLA